MPYLKLFEKLKSDIESGALTLTDAEKTLILEMDKLRGEFNTITYNPTGNASDLLTKRKQVRTPIYGGTNLSPSLKSYTDVSRADAAEMTAAIETAYQAEKQAIIEASKQLGKDSALATVDGILKYSIVAVLIGPY